MIDWSEPIHTTLTDTPHPDEAVQSMFHLQQIETKKNRNAHMNSVRLQKERNRYCISCSVCIKHLNYLHVSVSRQSLTVTVSNWLLRRYEIEVEDYALVVQAAWYE